MKLVDDVQKAVRYGALAVLRRPDVLFNHARYGREQSARPDVMESGPTAVEIEVTNRCNLACVQCLRSRGLKPYALGDVEDSAFRRILSQFPLALHITLNGFGEPLMHPRFFELVAHTRDKLPWAKISIYSNGTLLTGPVADRMIDSGLTEINVSIDAATAETYRKVRRGGRLEVVHANLRALLDLRRRRKKSLPLVGVNFVMLNENEDELVPFIEQAADIGVDFVNCVTYATYDWGFENRRSKASYLREIHAARRRLDELGLVCRALPRTDMRFTERETPFDCNFFWGGSVRVTFEGEVTLGCCTPFSETYSYGNVLETPFEQIWNGEDFRRNRALTRGGTPPTKTCASCREANVQFFAGGSGAGRRALVVPEASAAARGSEPPAPRVHLPMVKDIPAPRVVLVNPPALVGRTNERTFSGGIGVSRKLKPFEKESTSILPIDFLYLAAVAEKAGARVSFVDLLLDRRKGPSAERLCLDAVGPPPGRAGSWVGVRLSMPSLTQDLAFADRLKALLPDCRVFVFGSVIMATIDHWVKSTKVDYVLFGEPEAFFDQVLRAADPRKVDGVVDPGTFVPLRAQELYDEAKVTERISRWKKAESLSALPRPAWHLLDMDRYAPGGDRSQIGVYIQASRGCPLACTMCPYTLLEGDVWRANDIERVVSEVEYLNREHGIYRVRFRDANFGFKRRYAKDLAEALIARGVRIAATIESSVEVFDEETLALLRRAGIDTITTGVETNDAACMESLGQRIQINAKLRERIATCHELGFHVYGTYCLGTPEETWDTVESTWRFARELDVESGFTVMTPFPGTPMYWRALREGLLDRGMQFSNWNSYTATVRTYALSTTDLDMARHWARAETILSYRKRRAIQGGALATARFYGRHVPLYAWRAACRAYVAVRRRTSRVSQAQAPASP